jgi:predicted RNA binding protein YcfA (HicA-like mRNA interferase family)
VSLLRRAYGYNILRQTGSHIRLSTSLMGHEHRVTVPRHHPVRIGTLNEILGDVADYLGVAKDEVVLELFGR